MFGFFVDHIQINYVSGNYYITIVDLFKGKYYLKIIIENDKYFQTKEVI